MSCLGREEMEVHLRSGLSGQIHELKRPGPILMMLSLSASSSTAGGIDVVLLLDIVAVIQCITHGRKQDKLAQKSSGTKNIGNGSQPRVLSTDHGFLEEKIAKHLLPTCCQGSHSCQEGDVIQRKTFIYLD